MSIGRSTIMLNAMNNAEYYKGLTLYKEHALKIYSHKSFWKNEITLTGGKDPDDTNKDGVFVKLGIHLDTEKIVSQDCNLCDTRLYGNRLCKHGVCLALEYLDHVNVYSEKSLVTDKRIGHVFNKIDKEASDFAFLSASSSIKLFPTLVESPFHDGYYVTFQIGDKKPYILKDLSAFYLRMMRNELYSYGKQLTFVHNESSFSPSSIPILHFLLHELSGKTNTLAYAPDFSSERYIKIDSYNADQFFNFVGDNVELITDGEDISVPVIEANPTISCVFEHFTDEGVKVHLRAKYGIIALGYRMYLYYDHAIYHCDAVFSQKLGTFLEEMYFGASKEEDLKEFILNKKDLRAFLGKVILPAKKYISYYATDNLDLQEYEPDPLITKFYFDTDSDNNLTLLVEYTYGDTVILPYDENVHYNSHDLFRDQKTENYIMQLVRTYFSYDQEKKCFLISDEDLDIAFIEHGMNEFFTLGEVYASDEFHQITKPKLPKISVGVSLSGKLLDLNFDFSSFDQKEFLSILNSYHENKKYYRMKSGAFLNLEKEKNYLASIDDLFLGLDIKEADLNSGSIKVPVSRAFYIERLMAAASEDTSDIVLAQNTMSYLENFKTSQDKASFLVSKLLCGELHEYQTKGVQWLTLLHKYGFGGILADEMGLGKTVQLIAAFLTEYETNKDFHALIICPASLVYNWKNELNRFAPCLNTAMVIGDNKDRIPIIEGYKEHHVLITSYDLIRRDINLYTSCEFTFEILDEAQYIKNQQTKSAQAVKKINATTRFALTGTPVENRLSEIWSIFDFLMPGYLFSYARFKKNFELPIIKDNREECLKRLKNMISPFVLRRKKKDVLLELPDKLENVIYSQMDEEQEKLYQAVNLRLLTSLKNASEKEFMSSKIEVLSEILKLRQICCDPSLCFSNYHGSSAKLMTCIELISESIEAGHKLLVFSQFTTMLDRISQKLKEEKIDYYLLTGQTKKEERMRLVDAFQKNDDVKVFLISLKAGGTGLNLTSADIVIHFDPWWNMAVMNQATDRTHRIGQENIVSVHKLIMKDTIEEKILTLQNEKYALSEDILSLDESSISSLSKEDILSLLE